MKPLPLLACLLLAALCAACVPAAAGPAPLEPTPIVPADGLAAVAGQVAGIPPGWEGLPLSLYAAPFLGGGGESEGFFLLEPGLHPSTAIEGGSFLLNDLPPGEYVLVAGPSPEEARLLVDDERQPVVIEASANAVLRLGVKQLSE